MTNDDERGGRGVKNAENLMTSYVNDPLSSKHSKFKFFLAENRIDKVHYCYLSITVSSPLAFD